MTGVEPASLELLWVNLTQVRSDSGACACFAEKFAIRYLHNLAGWQERLTGRANASALLFEYDYPDRSSLDLLRATKNQYPSVPIIMLTEQHSEALAVWALHVRVWEYLVKPVVSRQVDDLYRELTLLEKVRRGSRGPRELLSRNESLPAEMRVGNLTSEARQLLRAEAYIDSHLDCRISLDEMAALCDMSPYRFSRLFKRVHKRTFQDFLLSRRIEKAVSLLANPSASVVDVAYLVGFRDPSYFARIFKRYTGVNPGHYRAYHGNTRDGQFDSPEGVVPLQLFLTLE